MTNQLMLDLFSTAMVVAVLPTQDGHRAVPVDGTHTVIHMVNMEHTANQLHNRLHTPDITKSLADNLMPCAYVRTEVTATARQTPCANPY